MTDKVKPARPGAAARLLRELLAEPGWDAEAVANELVVHVGRLASYVTGEREIPLERQMCLALLVVERCPRLARKGYALRGQVRAAMAVQSMDTEATSHSISFGR